MFTAASIEAGNPEMARSAFTLHVMGNKRWAVLLRNSGSLVAYLYEQSDGSGYRFRLINYGHRMSRLYKDERAALAALEKEIL